MIRRVALLVASGVLAVSGVLAAAAPVAAETCPAPKGKSAASRRCPTPPAKYEPYDPDRMRSGSRPGFIDLGNGTEVRVGGRARVDYDTRR